MEYGVDEWLWRLCDIISERRKEEKGGVEEKKRSHAHLRVRVTFGEVIMRIARVRVC